MKKETGALFFIVLYLFVLVSCGEEAKKQFVLQGETMGTYYDIRYVSSTESIDQNVIDSLLIDINAQLSTYIPTSTISVVNQTEGEVKLDSRADYFIDNIRLSDELYELTDGAFDPTVMPLVNYWGFGYEPKRAVTDADSQKIALIMNDVGWGKIDFSISPDGLKLAKGSAQLDLSAIAKGYAVDVLARHMEQSTVGNYKVEIGGEVRANGANQKGTPWIFGVSKPTYDAEEDEFVEYIGLSAGSMASSGNYRNYHEVEGRKYGHTINPKTGYPELNDLLAVTVIADNCAWADALATACMTMGYDRALYLINNTNNVSACFFTSGAGGDIIKTYSDGFIQHVYREH